MKTRLPALLTRSARRIDRLSLRERVTLFCGLCLTMLAVLDTLVISPATRAQTRQAQEWQRLDAEVLRLRDELRQLDPTRLDGADGAETRQRARLAELQGQRLARAQRLSPPSAGAPPAAPDRLTDLLPRTLGARGEVRLLGLATQPPSAASAPFAPGPAPAPALPGLEPTVRATAPGAPGGWQGTDLRLQGRYHALRESLAHLERDLPGVRWGSLRLRSAPQGTDPGGVVLDVRLWTLETP